MFDSQILEVAIGMAFFYLLLSLFCSTLNEWLGKILYNLRPNMLLAGIQSILGDDFTCRLYNHPLIKGLIHGKDQYEAESLEDLKDRSKLGKYLPSYIPSHTFALALTDIIAKMNNADFPKSCQELRDGVAKLPPMLSEALLPLIDSTLGDFEKARKKLETWYDDSMDRVTGWYKREAQKILLAVALLVTLVLNADSFMIANALYRNNALRATIVAAAEEAVKKPAAEASDASATHLKEINAQLEQLNLPLGWWAPKDPEAPGVIPKDVWGWLAKLFGWLFTALAISLGGPFWFDLLNKFINLRNAGKKPLTALEEETLRKKAQV